ncbi:prepilin-type N-terminal cleavage/methylation domain-containing protein [Ligilactobacillus sp. WILCCON 0076]|uniref:Prepilin-type N-terminal cleavage/methylation domain-containing protein n=1 Tax=Ligilactobacillus ubinensis TaxID=2876789 RepID=A0A9X2JKJ9_9LACO|nr:competence type IV pilus major pilin ComGC [Ligilactobacillus ubinensis]MCP0886272.1 prepilin-type N-terminal cleavage/methylation domain-containing protein [Ligilactobacillus ubinensis]
MKIKNKVQGFTLIEMVVVLFIISLLLLIVIPNVTEQRQHANVISDSALKTELSTQRQLYLSDNPTESTVSLEKLQEEKYLSSQQVKQIKERNLDD